MKCYYQVLDEDAWRKGEVVSMSCGKELNFYSRDDQGRIDHQLNLWNAEVLFHCRGLTATGLVSAGEGLYRLWSVEIRFRKPKEGS